MKRFWRRLFLCVLCLTVPCVGLNPVSALEPSEKCVSIETYEQLNLYCMDGDFSGTLQLSRDIEIGPSGLRIANNDTGSRELTIDLNRHDIIAQIGNEIWMIDVYANTVILDRRAKGSIIFQKADEHDAASPVAVIETFGYPSDDDSYYNDVSLRLENVSIVCLDKSIEAEVRTGLPGSSLELVHCSLYDVQVKNNCGNCLIEESQIKLERDNACAIQSIATPEMSGSSAGEIHWEEPWHNDDLQIKDSWIFVTGKDATGVEFQGYSMKVENSMISATGEGAVGISYGEYLFGDRAAVQPTVINSYISGLSRAIQYSKRDGDQLPIISNTGHYIYPDRRIDLPGAYKDHDGNIQQTGSDTKALYPINGEMIPGFVDVAPGDWYADAVMGLYQAHIMTGTSKASFGPNVQLSRGMVTTCIWRLENEPVVNDAIPFADVANGQYYTEAVRWAVSEGIVSGYDADHFGPNDAVTREQLAVMLYNYARYKGCDSAQAGMEIREFNDYESISGYASDATAWAVNARLMQGKNNSLMPKGNATRAQFAVMLHRFLATYDVFSDM